MTSTRPVSALSPSEKRATQFERLAQMCDYRGEAPNIPTELENLVFDFSLGFVMWNGLDRDFPRDFIGRWFTFNPGPLPREDFARVRELKNRNLLAAEMLRAVVTFDLTHTPASIGALVWPADEILREANAVANRLYRAFADEFLSTLPAQLEQSITGEQVVFWIEAATAPTHSA